MNTKNIFLGVFLLSITSSFTQLYSQSFGRMNLSYILPELIGLNNVHFVGNEVAVSINKEKPAGEYEIEFDSHSGEGQNLSNRIYFYQLKSGEFIQTKKMLLLK